MLLTHFLQCINTCIDVPFKELNTKSKNFCINIFKQYFTEKNPKSVFLVHVQVNKFIYQFRFWSNVHEATASTYICQIPPYYHIMLKNQNIIYV